MRRSVVVVLGFLVLVAGPAQAANAASVPRVPRGYSVAAQRELSPGVTETTLVRVNPPSVVHVATRSAGSPAELRVVLSNDAVAGAQPRLERTSS
ncbi:MAG: hypothetical protein WAT66_13370, partial [Actinomycetota bacterium]